MPMGGVKGSGDNRINVFGLNQQPIEEFCPQSRQMVTSHQGHCDGNKAIQNN